MKATATKWPATVTIELADDYLEGFAPGTCTEEVFIPQSKLQEIADAMAEVYIQTKGEALAASEAARKQNK